MLLMSGVLTLRVDVDVTIDVDVVVMLIVVDVSMITFVTLVINDGNPITPQRNIFSPVNAGLVIEAVVPVDQSILSPAKAVWIGVSFASHNLTPSYFDMTAKAYVVCGSIGSKFRLNVTI